MDKEKIKNIKQFLSDAKAVSPAIATLILIVIAAIAAAGIGILVSHSQGSSKQMLDTKTQSVQGQINIVGSTTVLPLSLLAGPAFMSDSPSYSVSSQGGGSGLGRYTAFTTQNPLVDVGASSERWPDSPDTSFTPNVPGRASVIIQDGQAGATVWETKVATSMVVVAYNNNAPGTTPGRVVNVTNTTTAVGTSLSYTDLRAMYATGTVVPTTFTAAAANTFVYYRSDSSGTMDTYMAWLGNPGYLNHVFTQPAGANIKYKGLPSNEEIRNAIAGCSNIQLCIGVLDVAFTGSNNFGNANVVAATQWGVTANAANKGLDKAYDLGSQTAATGISPPPTGTKGLARDLFYYTHGTPSGAIKAYLDFVTTNPTGQKAVTDAGFYLP
jgi:ABC-type phosphate transport system substrate-binding protein